MCSVSKDSVFNVAAPVFRKGANSLVGCLEHESKDGHSEWIGNAGPALV